MTLQFNRVLLNNNSHKQLLIMDGWIVANGINDIILTDFLKKFIFIFYYKILALSVHFNFKVRDVSNLY